MTPEPPLDADDYPTEETVAAIARWPHTDLAGCLDFVRAAWHWSDFAREDLLPAERELVHAEPGERFLRLATGGWSGNETIIAAMRDNLMLWMLCWQVSARGGLFIFKYPEACG